MLLQTDKLRIFILEHFFLNFRHPKNILKVCMQLYHDEIFIKMYDIKAWRVWRRSIEKYSVLYVNLNINVFFFQFYFHNFRSLFRLKKFSIYTVDINIILKNQYAFNTNLFSDFFRFVCCTLPLYPTLPLFILAPPPPPPQTALSFLPEPRCFSAKPRGMCSHELKHFRPLLA
jgi:hypothetical protein